MNMNHDAQLERRIDAELKSLPALAAPTALKANVLRMIAEREARGSGFVATAPVLSIQVRFALFLALAVVGALVCCAVLQAREISAFSSLAQAGNGFLQVLALLGGLIQTLLAACGMALRKLGAPLITALIAAAVLSYLTCVALGTIWWRVAFGHSTHTR